MSTPQDTILERIVRKKREEVAEAKRQAPLADWVDGLSALPAPRDFAGALRRGTGPIRVIAEVKKASPSKGVIRADFDPVKIAQAYAAGGASALSVLTDREFFQGELGYLAAIRKVCDLPLLRKDFIIDPYQVYEARRAGADAILLIAAILSDDALKSLRELAERLGLAVLVEVHTGEELGRTLRSGAAIVGINNRDLHSFHTDIAVTRELAPGIPAEKIRVSESGIHSREQVEALARMGLDAILVGESLMRQPDVRQALERLMGRA